jgi:hypothetical protein
MNRPIRREQRAVNPDARREYAADGRKVCDDERGLFDRVQKRPDADVRSIGRHAILA